MANTPNGLTKREYIAASVMANLCTPTTIDGPAIDWNYKILAECAVLAADALIDALNKEGGNQ